MSEYTPTTRTVRKAYALYWEPRFGTQYHEKCLAEFDHWFAAEKAKLQAEALREAAAWLDSFEGPGGRTSLHDRVGRDLIRLLGERADRIERGFNDGR